MFGPDTRHTFQTDRDTLFLQWKIRQFGKSLHGSEHTNKSRDLPAEFHHRILYLSHKLKESGHHAESHGTVPNPEYSPEESRDVAGGESKLDHQA